MAANELIAVATPDAFGALELRWTGSHWGVQIKGSRKHDNVKPPKGQRMPKKN